MRLFALLALVLAALPLQAKEVHGLKGKTEMAKSAKVALDAALATATGKSAGKAIEAELRKKHGKVVWEVEVLGDDGKVTEVDVDADSGAVVDSEGKK